MAGYVGKNAYIAFGGTAITADYRTFEWSEEAGVVDASAGTDAYVVQLTTQITGNASLTMRGISGTAGTATWNALANNTEGTLEFAPEGTATGNRKLQVNAIVSSRVDTMAYNNVAEWNINWIFNGQVTDTQY